VIADFFIYTRAPLVLCFMKIQFAPGPSELYFTVAGHLRQGIKDGVASISHRSEAFENISLAATGGLRRLLNIPDHFHIFFTSSATEVWERAIENLTESSSYHYVNGAFSQRFYEISRQLQRHAQKCEAARGCAFADAAAVDAELIAITHNETSTGVSVPLEWMAEVRKKNPASLLIVDAVSSLPYPAFDFSQMDSVFFSVQKGFGMPAGLGVWMVNDRCIKKAEALLHKGRSIGSYHNLLSLLENSKKNQTPSTPNVLAIYLLGCVTNDLLSRGIDVIRKETDYKASVLYHALAAHPLVKPFVTEKKWQSKTVIVANTGPHTAALAAYLERHGLLAGDGYGQLKKSNLRFANFPAHSKEQYERLADLIAAFDVSV
jgi:phosphoserine aminotransferase